MKAYKPRAKVGLRNPNPVRRRKVRRIPKGEVRRQKTKEREKKLERLEKLIMEGKPTKGEKEYALTWIWQDLQHEPEPLRERATKLAERLLRAENEDEAVRRYAAQAIGILKTENASKILEESYNKTRVKGVKLGCLYGMGVLGDERALPFLREVSLKGKGLEKVDADSAIKRIQRKLKKR